MRAPPPPPNTHAYKQTWEIKTEPWAKQVIIPKTAAMDKMTTCIHSRIHISRRISEHDYIYSRICMYAIITVFIHEHTSLDGTHTYIEKWLTSFTYTYISDHNCMHSHTCNSRRVFDDDHIRSRTRVYRMITAFTQVHVYPSMTVFFHEWGGYD